MPFYETEGSVKVLTRDSNGKLVSYIEGDALKVLNKTVSTQFLFNEHFFKEVITKDGKDYKVYEIRLDVIWTEPIPTVVGTTSISLRTSNGTLYVSVLSNHHHGFFKQAGDITTDLWTFLIPIS